MNVGLFFAFLKIILTHLWLSWLTVALCTLFRPCSFHNQMLVSFVKALFLLLKYYSKITAIIENLVLLLCFKALTLIYIFRKCKFQNFLLLYPLLLLSVVIFCSHVIYPFWCSSSGLFVVTKFLGYSTSGYNH